MPLEIVSAENVMTGRRGRAKGERYAKYAESLKPHIAWLKDSIKSSQDGFIRLKVRDLAKEMGPEYLDKDERSLYTAIRYILFGEGIYVELGTHKDGDKIFIMRFTNDDDSLPQYLKDKDEEDNEETLD